MSIDIGWTKKSNGNCYDSSTGHTFGVGKFTGKVISYALFCKTCRKFDRKVPHASWSCSKNYEGSLKGMEAAGVEQIVLDLFYKNHCYIRELVLDDDSTTHAWLSHPGQELNNPVYKKRKSFAGGMLPVEHPSIFSLLTQTTEGEVLVQSYGSMQEQVKNIYYFKTRCKASPTEFYVLY